MRTRIGTEGPFICFILWVETAGKKRLKAIPLTIPIPNPDKKTIFVLTDIYRTAPRQNKFHLLCSRFVPIFAKDDKHRRLIWQHIL